MDNSVTPFEVPQKSEISTIGHRIRSARKDLNLNQEALAARLGVTQPTVANWEADVHNPRQLMLAKLAEALNVSLGWLAGGESSERRHHRHAATGYLSRNLFHVPVLPPTVLRDPSIFASGSLDNIAVDYIPMSGYAGKLFAVFADPGDYAALFPGETLFVLDHERQEPTPGCYGLISTPEGPKLIYWRDGSAEMKPDPAKPVIGTLIVTIRFF